MEWNSIPHWLTAIAALGVPLIGWGIKVNKMWWNRIETMLDRNERLMLKHDKRIRKTVKRVTALEQALASRIMGRTRLPTQRKRT
jgi:hypothetical protein